MSHDYAHGYSKKQHSCKDYTDYDVNKRNGMNRNVDDLLLMMI